MSERRKARTAKRDAFHLRMTEDERAMLDALAERLHASAAWVVLDLVRREHARVGRKVAS